MKRILSVILVLALALSVLPAVYADEADTTSAETTVEVPATTEESEEDEDEVKVITDEEAFAQMTLAKTDGDLQLYYHEGDFLNMAIKNTKTGELWFTNPPNALGETREKGLPKTTLASQLYVVMLDTTTKSFYANSHVACYNKDTCTVEVTDEGILVTYDFKRASESFTIPVLYTIENGTFRATVLTKQIVEYGSQRILTIELLPHFGAGSLNDEGYILIPDGSGAVMNFNTTRGGRGTYAKPIYGTDRSKQEEFMEMEDEEIRMPVFGIVKNNQGYVATVENADATIYAAGSSNSATYNHAYAAFNYRKKDSYETNEGTYKAKENIIIGQYVSDSEDFSVVYMFLEPDDISYSGMARRYREYLIEEKGFEKKTDSFTEDMPTFLQVYGELPRETSIMGIPVTKYEPLSKYSEVADIIKDLSSKGVNNLLIDYIGWQKNGPNEKVPTKLTYSSQLGGKKEFNALLEVAEEYNAKIFPRVEFMQFSQAGNGYAKSALTAKSALRTPIQEFRYHLGSGMRTIKNPVYYIKTELYDAIVNKYLKKAEKFNLTNVSVDSLTGTLYSDFESKAFYSMDQLEDTVLAQLEKITEKQSVLATAPNDYALKYTDYVSSLASFSSDYLYSDYEVPFMQTVLHGYIPYSSESISSSDDIEEAFLKTIETGSALLFQITANEARVMKDTPKYNFLYCSEYGLWSETAKELYAELNGILGDLQQVEIQNHERLQDEVFMTTYADGTQIIVNYNDNEVTVNETLTIPAKDYKVIKAEGGVQ